MFKNNNCSHAFCRACLSQHIEAKLQENIAVIKCPEVQCKAVLEPEICRDIVPIGVFEKWQSALCESMVLDAKKFYCPFEDCSMLLLDDAEEKVAQAECPSCRRMFCAQCKVVWHAGLSCQEFQSLDPNEKGEDDLILMELAKQNKWMRCPSCKFFVEKSEGCWHITCRTMRSRQKWSSSTSTLRSVEIMPVTVADVLGTFEWMFKGGDMMKAALETRLCQVTLRSVYPDGMSSEILREWPNGVQAQAIIGMLRERARAGNWGIRACWQELGRTRC
ncbi:hypothetical protein J5N97_009253 [Dioscorea zingiberensis]|uniref:RBR-type E3 ubiquitin transferase n=1 Tax=Dioscorea zingiberensis TaxID=325984 RepID=A0A9D5CX76_9LILI|nr:hypothetical protein J5N97_009253 [Dioscorea zingiberensis]